MNNLKNPLLLGLLGAAITFGYLWYERNQRTNTVKQNLNAAAAQGVITPDQLKQQTNVVDSEQISFFYPIVVGVLVWFVATLMFKSNGTSSGSGTSGNCTSSDLLANISDSISLEVVKPKNSNLWR